jgi:hypothetical protein
MGVYKQSLMQGISYDRKVELGTRTQAQGVMIRDLLSQEDEPSEHDTMATPGARSPGREVLWGKHGQVTKRGETKGMLQAGSAVCGSRRTVKGTRAEASPARGAPLYLVLDTILRTT